MKTNKHFINLFNFNFNLKNTFNKLFKKIIFKKNFKHYFNIKNK